MDGAALRHAKLVEGIEIHQEKIFNLTVKRAGQLANDSDETGIEDISANEVIIPEGDNSAFSWRKLWAFTGPGWLMSIAYLDPGNLEADLQGGAYCQFQLLWVLLVSTCLGLALQILAARLGVVTGKDLATLCREEYSRKTSIILWMMTETAIIGSDIQEIIGSAIAFRILIGIPLWCGTLLTGLDTLTFLGLHYFGIRKLEAFFALLICMMVFCFFINFFADAPPPSSFFEGIFVPTLEEYAVVQAVAVLGAVIMPHNIYLHSALVQSRAINRTNRDKVAEANKYFSIEAAIALAVSFLINASVISVFARGFFSDDGPFTIVLQDNSTFHQVEGSFCASGYSENRACIPCSVFGEKNFRQIPEACKAGGDISDAAYADLERLCPVNDNEYGYCDTIGLSEAGDALSHKLGDSARIFWAIGLLAAGQSSTMTGTYAGQFVMQGFLQLKIPAWQRVALTRSIALVPALSVALIGGNSDSMDEWLNVLQSVQLPFALIPVLQFTSNPGLMGEFQNGPCTKAFIWSFAFVLCLVNVYLVISYVASVTQDPAAFLLLAFAFWLYFYFIWALIKRDVRKFVRWCENFLFSLVAQENFDREREKLLGDTTDR